MKPVSYTPFESGRHALSLSLSLALSTLLCFSLLYILVMMMMVMVNMLIFFARSGALLDLTPPICFALAYSTLLYLLC